MGFKQSQPASALDRYKKIKALINGPSGAGKSTLCAKGGSVFYIPTELQGLTTVAHTAGDDVTVFHNADSRPGMRSMRDIDELMSMLGDPLIAEFDVVALDSLTDFQEILFNFYDKKFPDKDGDGSYEKWGAIKKDTQKLLRKLRDLPTHVIVTTLDMESKDGERMVHRPILFGKSSGFPNQVPKYFNLVGHAFKKQSVDGIIHNVMFSGPSKYLTKKLAGLDDIEPPEPQLWANKLFGEPMSEDAEARVAEWTALRNKNA